DSKDQTTEGVFHILVGNQAPVLDPVLDQKVEPGDAVQLTLAGHDGVDGPDKLRYFLVDGPGTVDPLTGAYTWPGRAEEGKLTVTVRVVDGDGNGKASDPVSFVIRVGNQAPVLDAVADQKVEPEEPVQLT